MRKIGEGIIASGIPLKQKGIQRCKLTLTDCSIDVVYNGKMIGIIAHLDFDTDRSDTAEYQNVEELFENSCIVIEDTEVLQEALDRLPDIGTNRYYNISMWA